MTQNPKLWGVETAVQELAQEMARSLPVTLASVALWDQPSYALSVRAIGAPRPFPTPLTVGARIRLSKSHRHRAVFESHEPLLVELSPATSASAQEDAGLTLVPNLRSVYLLPIRVGDETVGVLELGEMRAPEREPFTEDKQVKCRAILEEFLAASAHAWEAGRLRRQIRAMSSLLRLVTDIVEARSFQDVLACCAAEVADWLGTPVRGILFQARPENATEVVGRWEYPEPMTREDGTQLMLALARADRTGRFPISVVNVADDPLDPLHGATQAGETWTRVSLPLIQGDRFLGAVCLYVEDELRPTEWQLEAFRGRAEIAALGMGIVTGIQEQQVEQEWLGRAAYQLLTTHQRTVLHEALAGILRVVSTLLPALVERVAYELADPQLVKGSDWRRLADTVGGEVTTPLEDLRAAVASGDEAPPVSVDINALVRQAIEIARAKWADEPGRRGVSVQLHFAPLAEPLIVETSLTLVGALVHAIENAVEAMPGGGQIHVRTARTNGHVLISVRDTGPGMAEEHRAAAFMPLFSTKPGPHLGLGLPAVHALVRRHGGTVSLECPPPGGTLLEIRLPVSGGRVAESEGSADKPEGKSESPGPA